jgi:PadR family transcriptional regulator, regulatory protein AphA
MNIRTLCLGILSLQEASGYEIKKEIEEGVFNHFIDASFGSIYPALTQLNAEGLLSVRSEEQSGRPDKKVYATTELGRAVLTKSLSVIPARDKYKSEFLFEMLLKHLLSQNHINLAIAKQHADLKEDLARIDNCMDEMADLPGAAFVSGYGRAVLTAAVNYIEECHPELRMPAFKAAE